MDSTEPTREELEHRELLRRIDAGKREAAKRFWHSQGIEDARAADAAALAAPRHRGPGRPSWTSERFAAHYRDAVAAAGGITNDRVVAAHFRALDGDQGIDPASLAKLRRRFAIRAQ